MFEYRLYCLNNANHIVSRHECHAEDDLAALAHAATLCGKYEVEAWEGTRLVGRLARDGTASVINSNGPQFGV